MTSGSFTTLDLGLIFVDRAERQRRELKGIPELAESIRTTGLINPIVVTRDYKLVAGERRYTACKSLGWTALPVQWADELDPTALYLIELEENVKRLDLTWQEQNDSIARYHELLASQTPGWSQAQTARALGMSDASVSNHLIVARVRQNEPDLEVDKAEKFSTAIGLASRSNERKQNTVLQEIAGVSELVKQKEAAKTAKTEPGAAPSPPSRRAEILNEDFHAWAKQDRPKYNLIHCDFPYGVSTGDKKGQSAAKRLGAYDDGEHVYWSLVETLITMQDNFIAPQAHLVFWFSMKFYEPTLRVLETAGWKVDPFPFIWHKSDGAGIIPDSNRGPRRTYETALFASRGDQKIIRPVANSFAAPTTKDFHTSEKSATMLEHFFRMLVDDSTALLDPTCGSGMAVRVAEKMGASAALGLECDPEFAATARRNCGLAQA